MCVDEQGIPFVAHKGDELVAVNDIAAEHLRRGDLSGRSSVCVAVCLYVCICARAHVCVQLQCACLACVLR